MAKMGLFIYITFYKLLHDKAQVKAITCYLTVQPVSSLATANARSRLCHNILYYSKRSFPHQPLFFSFSQSYKIACHDKAWRYSSWRFDCDHYKVFTMDTMDILSPIHTSIIIYTVSIPADFIWEVGYTMRGSSIYRRGNTKKASHSHLHSHLRVM